MLINYLSLTNAKIRNEGKLYVSVWQEVSGDEREQNAFEPKVRKNELPNSVILYLNKEENIASPPAVKNKFINYKELVIYMDYFRPFVLLGFSTEA